MSLPYDAPNGVQKTQRVQNMEDKDALIAHYHGTRVGLLEAIDGLSGAQMTERALDGWSIADHLAHIALWDDVRAQEVGRISAGHESVWRMDDKQDAAYNDLGYAMRANLSLEQVRWELTNSRERLLEAIAAATPAGLDASRYGEAGLRSTHEVQHAAWIRRWRGEQGISVRSAQQ